MKEKVGCGNLPQLAEFVRLATPLARFGKVVRTASKQDVVGSSPTGRATSFIFNDLWVKAFLSDRLLFRQMDRHGGIKLFFSLLLLIQLFA
jgi:hypothetical protein